MTEPIRQTVAVIGHVAASALLALVPVFAGASVSYAVEQVYMTEEEAREAIFPEATEFDEDRHLVRDEGKQKLKEDYGVELRSHKATFVKAVRQSGEGENSEEETLGYVYYGAEPGKHKPIDFAVGISPESEVVEVHVLVYREKIGDEVKKDSWLDQFEGKGIDDNLDKGSISKISGATISSWSLLRGVRKALALHEYLYQNSDSEA